MKLKVFVIVFLFSFLNAENTLSYKGKMVNVEKVRLNDGSSAIKFPDIEKPVKMSGRMFIKLNQECLEKGKEKCLKELECTEKAKLFLKNWTIADCGKDVLEKSQDFRKNGFYARPELMAPAKLYSIEPLYLNDTYQNEQWNFHNTGNVTSADGKLSVRGSDHSHVQETWTLLKRLGQITDDSIGADRKIGIIDDGFDIQHEDLKDNFLSWKNFSGPVEEDNMFSETVGTTDNFHGTLVTGIAAARGNNSLGTAGVCPSCGIIGARMDADSSFDPNLTPEQYFDSIFTWVYEQGAEVINCSWGPDATINQEYFDELFSTFASEGRGGLGTVIVFASGNSGEDFSWNPFASHPDTISVGATDSTGKRYDFSNYGKAIDIMAPTAGGEKSGTSKYYDRIWSTDNFLRPDCLAEGATPTNGCSDKAGWTPNSPVAGGDGWWGKYSFRFSHTSSAAPLVTGVIALMLEANQGLTVSEVKEILALTADRVSVSDANYNEYGHSDKYGYGRVNALRAVAAAWIKGDGEITLQTKEDIDNASPCTREDCWDFEGVEFPDEELVDESYDEEVNDYDFSSDEGDVPDSISEADNERIDETEVPDNSEVNTDIEKEETQDENTDSADDDEASGSKASGEIIDESSGCSISAI